MLVDDHPPLRAGVAAIVDKSSRFRVVAEAGSLSEAIAAIRSHKPDVVILDVSLADGSGLDLTRMIRREQLADKVLFLSMHARRALAENALAAGADGYLLKESTGENLLSALEMVVAGDTYLDPGLGADGVDRSRPSGGGTSPDDLRLARLSDRELEVFRLLASGRNSKEIGALLGISSKTVDNHRASLIEKIEADSIAELVRFAIRTGVIDP